MFDFYPGLPHIRLHTLYIYTTVFKRCKRYLSVVFLVHVYILLVNPVFLIQTEHDTNSDCRSETRAAEGAVHMLQEK